MISREAPLTRRLFLLAAAAIVPLAAMAGGGLLALWKQQQAQAERAGIEITRALSTAVDAELSRAVAGLQGIAIGPALERGEFERYHNVMRRMLAQRPDWVTITLADTEGNQLLNARRGFSEKLEKVVDPESLRAVVKTAKPVVGEMTRGPGGDRAVPVRVPVIRDGTVRFVLTAAVKPDAFIEVLQRQRLPEDWVVSVFDSRNQRVARSRQHEQALGGAPSPSLADLMARSGDEGSGVTRALEGDEVYSAYSRSRSSGWTVAIGIPAALVEAGARRSLAAYGAGLLLSLALAIFAVLAIGRSAARIDAERARLLAQAQDAQKSAEDANRAKDAFLAMLSHELRNPLGAIANATQLLEHAQSIGYAKGVIARQVTHLTRLTDDLLDAARAMTGKIVLQRRPLDLAAATRESIATLKSASRTAGRHIVDSLGSAWVHADPVRIEQIVANLVVNAVKYSPLKGVIRVTVRREGHAAVLEVSDDGIGMPADLVPRVFDAFVQGEHDLDRARGGLGLGLTLVRRLAELHGGDAQAASAGPGRGSKFTVRLPAIEAPPAPVSTNRFVARAAAREILIVEDNPDAGDSLRHLLELAGHRVHLATDGVAGLEALLSRPPEVALIDIGLPRMDGYELVRRARAAFAGRTAPLLVAVTGYGLAEDRDRALAAGFDEHLVKPVDPGALDELLARER